MRVILCLVMLCLRAGTMQATTRTATSCNVSDIQDQITAASDGDTVIIPNGSCTWASGIATGKQITLQGESVGGVTITHGAGSGILLTMTIGASFRTTVANLRFLPGSGTGVYVLVQGLGLPPLMHDCYFNLPNFQLAHAVRWEVSGGVIWNTTFESTDYGSAVYGSDSGCLVVRSGTTVPWSAASSMGALDVNGDKNLYIEDSTFKFVGQCPDAEDNARVVMRHNQIIGSSGLTHGSTGTYGGRHVEIYDNTITFPQAARALDRYFWFRAGTAVITGNTIDDITGGYYGDKNEFAFTVENAYRAGQFGCCTSYMCFHQSGSGSDGVSQISDPVYVWGNTGTAQGKANMVGLNEGSPQDCFTGHTTSEFFVLNRDYFVDSGAKPGWTRYTYPHPLVSGAVPPDPPASGSITFRGRITGTIR